jgi:hypothetical protein
MTTALFATSAVAQSRGNPVSRALTRQVSHSALDALHRTERMQFAVWGMGHRSVLTMPDRAQAAVVRMGSAHSELRRLYYGNGSSRQIRTATTKLNRAFRHAVRASGVAIPFRNPPETLPDTD